MRDLCRSNDEHRRGEQEGHDGRVDHHAVELAPFHDVSDPQQRADGDEPRAPLAREMPQRMSLGRLLAGRPGRRRA